MMVTDADSTRQDNRQGAQLLTRAELARRRFWRRGEPQVWATAASLVVMLSLAFILIAVVAANGLGVFWPGTVAEVKLIDGVKILGERIRSEVNPDTSVSSTQFKTGNRELDPQRQDFLWIRDDDIQEIRYPQNAVVLERLENGNFYGYLDRIDPKKHDVVAHTAAGREMTVAGKDVVRCWTPNTMGIFAKCCHYLVKMRELLFDGPRESNTEGGLFPAIFGTVMLIFLMAITCFPLGVLAGIYLGEYAKDGLLVRIVRIAVNNLAGIPSIVYGIFGLGFFVYGVGGLLDQWLFAEKAATGTPTFGTGGILWASLTLGLLTVPVVIVSTEEALRAIPRSIREGSLALGATKLQTLVRVLVPMALPGMLTGFILAMARAAGEVAPLMITGVVKLAPQMPIDRDFPFFHLDRKFMHLGFHIYDVGFQSPNVEASKPMVYVTTLLLLLIVLIMSSSAIILRNRMRKRFQIRTI